MNNLLKRLDNGEITEEELDRECKDRASEAEPFHKVAELCPEGRDRWEKALGFNDEEDEGNEARERLELIYVSEKIGIEIIENFINGAWEMDMISDEYYFRCLATGAGDIRNMMLEAYSEEFKTFEERYKKWRSTGECEDLWLHYAWNGFSGLDSLPGEDPVYLKYVIDEGWYVEE